MPSIKLPALSTGFFTFDWHYVGRRPADDMNSYYVPQYNTFDLGGRYSAKVFGKLTTWLLTFNNVSNVHYWSTLGPGSGKVAIVVRPAAEKRFAVRLRVPTRDVSRLYTTRPAVEGLKSLAVNGSAEPVKLDNGYAVIERDWRAGDRIELELPLEPQRVKADDKVAADRGRVALRYGPLIYCVESADQNVDQVLPPDAPLTTEWKPDLLRGVVVIHGQFADGKPLLAIPYYARANRGGRSVVWIRDK